MLAVIIILVLRAETAVSLFFHLVDKETGEYQLEARPQLSVLPVALGSEIISI